MDTKVTLFNWAQALNRLHCAIVGKVAHTEAFDPLDYWCKEKSTIMYFSNREGRCFVSTNGPISVRKIKNIFYEVKSCI